MANDVVLLEIQEAVDLPVIRIRDRNPRLKKTWNRSLKTDYQLPTPMPVPPGDPLYGTSSDTALHWLREVRRKHRLEMMYRFTVKGGQGFCSQPSTDRYPIEVVDGYMSFYQNLLDWYNLSYTNVIYFSASFARSLLTASERDAYGSCVRTRTSWSTDFEQYFMAVVEANTRRLNPYDNKKDQQAKLAIIENLFRPETLIDRAHRVENFRVIG